MYELNSEADAKANYGRNFGHAFWLSPMVTSPFRYLRATCDGSLKDQCCGAGFLIYGSNAPGDADDNWICLAWIACRVQASSITAAELEALAGAMLFVICKISAPEGCAEFAAKWAPESYPQT